MAGEGRQALCSIDCSSGHICKDLWEDAHTTTWSARRPGLGHNLRLQSPAFLAMVFRGWTGNHDFNLGKMQVIRDSIFNQGDAKLQELNRAIAANPGTTALQSRSNRYLALIKSDNPPLFAISAAWGRRVSDNSSNDWQRSSARWLAISSIEIDDCSEARYKRYSHWLRYRGPPRNPGCDRCFTGRTLRPFRLAITASADVGLAFQQV